MMAMVMMTKEKLVLCAWLSVLLQICDDDYYDHGDDDDDDD